jgi:hypothetical protein
VSHRALEWVKALGQHLRGGPVRAVLFVMADHANADGLVWVGHRTLAAESGVSRRHIQKTYLPALLDLKVIEETEPARGTRAARYRFLYPDHSTLPPGLPSGDPRSPLATSPG